MLGVRRSIRRESSRLEMPLSPSVPSLPLGYSRSLLSPGILVRTRSRRSGMGRWASGRFTNSLLTPSIHSRHPPSFSICPSFSGEEKKWSEVFASKNWRPCIGWRHWKGPGGRVFGTGSVAGWLPFFLLALVAPLMCGVWPSHVRKEDYDVKVTMGDRCSGLFPRATNSKILPGCCCSLGAAPKSGRTQGGSMDAQ